MTKPSPRASEEEWDAYLSDNIVWAIDLSQYNIIANVSVITDKTCKNAKVFVELNNCKGQVVTLKAIAYNANKRIVGYGPVFIYRKVLGTEIDFTNINTNCPIAKIDKIVIGGKIEIE